MNMPPPIAVALALLIAYLLGSIPWGFVLVRAIKGVDVRSVGSGNIGATNASRAGGRKLGLAVFALDFAKGAIGVELAHLAAHTAWLPIACGAAAVIGHCFSVWMRFRGGKGVATLCGVVIALSWPAFLIGGAVWIAVVALTRYAGLASMAMALAFPCAEFAISRGQAAIESSGLAMLALLILVRHRSNMARMLAGTEPKIGQKRAGGGAAHG